MLFPFHPALENSHRGQPPHGWDLIIHYDQHQEIWLYISEHETSVKSYFFFHCSVVYEQIKKEKKKKKERTWTIDVFVHKQGCWLRGNEGGLWLGNAQLGRAACVTHSNHCTWQPPDVPVYYLAQHAPTYAQLFEKCL